MKIPNALTLGVFPVILAYRFYFESFDGLWDALFAYLAVTIVLFIPFMLRGIGAGDLKFLGNIAAYIGMTHMLECFLYGALFSVPLMIVFLGKNWDRVIYLMHNKKPMEGDGAKFAYSPPFALGTIIYLLNPGLLHF